MGKTGKSDKKYAEAAIMVAGTAAMFAMDTIPGMDIIQMGGLMVDMIDPFGYNSTLTRDAIDTHSKAAYDSIREIFTSEEYKKKLYKSIDEASPNLSKEDRNRIFANATSPWKIHNLQPKDYKFCFADFVNPGQKRGRTDDVCKSGPPVEGCDHSYTKSYNEFISNNKTKYNQEKINTGIHLQEFLKKQTTGLVISKNFRAHKIYNSNFTVITTLLIILLVGIVTYYLFAKFIFKT
jgi:hypothetical protein